MIGRLLSRLDGVASSAILLREAARTSRRWQTYASRTGFSGALFGVLLLGIWSFMNAGTDPADMGWMGRWIFIAFSTVMLLLAITLSPLMTSAAMIEETEDRTLEMLILSKLSPARILTGKVLSRILQLLTIVFGALPVLAMVVTLGGVAPHQVVAVVLHTLVAVVLTGALGAFYGLFTKSPMLAMLASVSYGFVAFLLFPGAYILLTAKPEHAAHFSLFAGPATQDWAAVVSLFSYIPSLGVMLVVGTRLFELQISNADIRQAFSGETWGTTTFLWSCLAVFLSLVLVFPASFILYSMRLSQTSNLLATALVWGGAFIIWAWATAAMTLTSWVLLRVGVDVVDAMDAILGGRDKRDRERPDAHVWSNPVAWREARPAAWGANGMPLLVTWLLLMLGMLQTGWWMLPGGALMMGVMNSMAALGLTIWLTAKSVDEERRKDSLVVLLTTTLASHRILFGKSLGVAAITFPLLLLSLPFVAFGLPYLHVVDLVSSGDASAWSLFVEGVLAWCWTLPLWAVLLNGSFFLALSVKRSRSGFAVALGVLMVCLLVPTTLGRLFEDVIWIATPTRLLVPPLAGGAAPWHYVVSIAGWGTLAIALFGVTSYGLRRWIIAAMVGLLAVLGVPTNTAQAQARPTDELVIAARPLAEGLVRPGEWAAIQVSVQNLGKATSGRVQLTERAGDRSNTYFRSIELPEQGRKDLVLLYRPSTSRAERELVLETPLRRATTRFKVRPASPGDATIGILGTDAMGLQLLRGSQATGLVGRAPRESTEQRALHTGLIEPGVLPQHSSAYDAFDQLVWPNANPGLLDPSQVTALTHWVADGGHLTLTVTENASAIRDSSLADLLPLDLRQTEDHDDLGALRARWPTQVPVLPIATGRERGLASREVFTLLKTDDGTPLWVTSTYGLGTVSVLTFDPRALKLTTNQRDVFWRHVLSLPNEEASLVAPLTGVQFDATGTRSDLLDPQAFLRARQRAIPAKTVNNGPEDFRLSVAGDDAQDNHAAAVRELLSDIPGVAPLPLEWLLAFSALYLFTIGPLDWFVLRALRRQPWTWVTFPVSIVVFSTLALLGTAWVKGSQAVVTSIEVVDLLPGTQLWRGQNHIGVFATSHTRVGLQGPTEDALVHPRKRPGYADELQIEGGFGPGTTEWTAETWTLGYASARWLDDRVGDLTLTQTPSGLVVSNQLDRDLLDVEVLQPGSDPRVYAIGALASGTSKPLPPDTVGLSDGTTDLATLRRLYHRAPSEGEGHLNTADYPYVILATADPIRPVRLSGVRPEHQRMTLLRAPVTHVGESP